MSHQISEDLSLNESAVWEIIDAGQKLKNGTPVLQVLLVNVLIYRKMQSIIYFNVGPLSQNCPVVSHWQ